LLQAGEPASGIAGLFQGCIANPGIISPTNTIAYDYRLSFAEMRRAILESAGGSPLSGRWEQALASDLLFSGAPPRAAKKRDRSRY
jgi:hypothetical protein